MSSSSKRAAVNIRLGRLLYSLGIPAFMLYLRFRQSARVIVESGDQYLLVKPWLGSGAWLLPGGGRRLGESFVHAAVRELREETGIAISPESLATLGTFRCQHGKHLVSHEHVFWVHLATMPELRASVENVEIAWQPTSVMEAACGNPNLVEALHTARTKANLL